MRLPLIPRETKFYTLFIEDAANMVAAARVLEQLMAHYEDRERLASQLRDLEHAGDVLTHDIGHQLEATFVTPFDREDILAFINRAESSHPEVRSWSEKTRLAVAQKYAASIRDFGLAKGTSRKSTIRPALYASPVRLLVRALRLAGIGPLEIVHSRAFRLLALDESEVIDALGELNRLGALRFRMQSDVVELDVRESA